VAGKKNQLHATVTGQKQTKGLRVHPPNATENLTLSCENITDITTEFPLKSKTHQNEVQVTSCQILLACTNNFMT